MEYVGADAMIIQTAREGQPRFAIRMDEHSTLSGLFARAFGNERFDPISPGELLDLVVYVVAHHDKGWVEFDGAPKTDPRTGFPYNLVDTPAEDITRTSTGSPDFNEKHHPYCGLLSSMHSWGLYNGRYGTSDYVLIDTIPQHQRHLADDMLEREVKRQQRLKAELMSVPATAAWANTEQLFRNYKLLQFFDMLALYFNRVHESARGQMTFAHVPSSAREDSVVTIKPIAAGVYGLSPYPFAQDNAEFSFSGRYIEPLGPDAARNWQSALRLSPTVQQSFRLKAA